MIDQHAGGRECREGPFMKGAKKRNTLTESVICRRAKGKSEDTGDDMVSRTETRTSWNARVIGPLPDGTVCSH